MKKIIAFISIVLGVGLVSAAIYFLAEPTMSRSIGNILAMLSVILAGIVAAGTGIRNWLELLRGSRKSTPETNLEISGDLARVSTREDSRNIQTGGNYIEKLELTLSAQDNSAKRQVDFQPKEDMTLTNADRAKFEKALQMASRALEILQEQASGYTSLTIPVHLKIDLEEKQQEVDALKRKLHGLG